ncbi:hypothetical protein [Lysobacter solisilvae (ex Woo and Kim 2020)]|uniref:Uncharacterized protein n=1 Tax=Agrilutibacter terrestris TaxID=2865112 RepID=A0A7H0FUL5_9GAMM|nr:hypothetical protein [Lysobacter terrestris]QNP39731.1 hypothetical protein H8B22_09410 [Lysobacter terrestris]
MNPLLQSLNFRLKRVFRIDAADAPRATQKVVTREGWPPLSATPLLRRRRTDALPWFPHGPRDDWKR